ncbi:MAG: hypothetical protein H0W09_03725 [Solirubrobacterales bacterium]|nr:hypothetical protein [Solirubrobacterales bacterium]
MTSTIRTIFAALLTALLLLGAAACGDEESDSSSSSETSSAGGEVAPIEEISGASDVDLTIGSKNFTEQYILGEIYAQAFEAAGYKVDTELDLGSEQIAYKALRDGDISAYPEYTGTALTSFFDVETADVPNDSDEAYELAKDEYAKVGITAPGDAPFNNTFVLASLPETQEEVGGEAISDIAAAPDAESYRLAGFPECRQRTDCLLGLEDLYGWKPEFISTEAKFEPLDQDQSDFSLAFATDPELSLGDYAVYEDDEGLFPPYHITLSMSDEVAEEIGPDGIELVERVQEPLTDEVMSELNARVDLDKEEPEDVAGQYLEESGFVQ